MSVNQTAIPSVVAIPRMAEGQTRRTSAAAKRVAVCAGLLALLMAWAVVFPQTGDGDAIMHYLNAHDSLWQPAKLMGSWARVGSKIYLLIPAQFGVLAARWAAAVVSVLCAWQTVRLAEDLKMENALLAAPFLIFQPFVFSLAGDTMTELPFALGVIIAIRLWMKGRYGASCWVMGYLPTVRPEGFFLCALWGAMLIGERKPKLILALGWGTMVWMIGCWVWWGDPMYCFRAGWSWPADSLRVYGRGSFFWHVNRWPVYCGPVLFVLFLAGVWRVGGTRGAAHTPLNGWGRALSIAGIGVIVLEMLVPAGWREGVLPWMALGLVGAIAWRVRGEKFAVGIWVFLLIFTLHTVLWWRGWFGSCGLMRILACVGPITAIVCLAGWNAVVARAANFWRVLAIVAIGLTAMVYYIVDPLHQRIFPLQTACEFVSRHDLLRDAPMIVFGDPMAQAALKMRPNPPNILHNDCDAALERAHLARAPVGSVGLWDNQHAQQWFGVSISDLTGLGYTTLFRAEQRPRFAVEWAEPANMPRDQVYVVIRKDRP
jgi:hypothetical protein